MKRMAYLLLGLAGLALLLLAGLQVWFLSFRVSDPQRIASLEAQAIEKLRARDERASHQESNGFLRFQKVFYAPEGSPEARTFGGLDDDAPIQPKDLQAYEARLPQLEQLLSSPELLWPSQYDQGMQAQGPNLGVLRGLYLSLSAYVDALLARRQTDRALRWALLGLSSSRKWLENGRGMGKLVVLTNYRVALSSVLRVTTSGQLSTAQLRQVLAALQANQLPQSFLIERMDEELAFTMKSIDQLENGTATLQQSNVPGWIPGYFERERRIIQQLYLQDRKVVESMQAYPAQLLIDRNQLTRSYALVVRELYPNIQGPYDYFRYSLDFDRAAPLVVALQLYHGKHKRYPERLEELVPEVLPELPRDLLASDGRFVYRPEGESFKLGTSYGAGGNLGLNSFYPSKD